MGIKSALAGVALLGSLAFVVAPAGEASAAPVKYKNCAALNKAYPHGVARPGARDKTKSKPVTTFRVNKSVCQKNTHLDRDKDGIACEKR
ncbi:MAG: excalibur calcium-binding domain-containing protein [Gordonia sp. (in: high G+C Gram-positive bacteria)]